MKPVEVKLPTNCTTMTPQRSPRTKSDERPQRSHEVNRCMLASHGRLFAVALLSLCLLGSCLGHSSSPTARHIFENEMADASRVANEAKNGPVKKFRGLSYSNGGYDAVRKATHETVQRKIQEAGNEDGHDHDQDHDHDHAEDGATAVDDGHDDHDHGDHDDHDHTDGAVAEVDDHDGHDHGEEAHDDHDGHDHGEEAHDDHDGHDHGDHDDQDHGDHDDHDHSDHDGHDHGDHDDHDHGDHDGHAHTSGFQSSRATGGEKPWGQVIGASLLVNLTALVGVILLIPTVSGAGNFAGCSQKLFDVYLPAFAAGALLAMAALIIIPESGGYLVASDVHAGEDHAGHDHDEHAGEISWKFGVSLLGGFLLPLVLGAVFPRAEDHMCDDQCEASEGECNGTNAKNRSTTLNKQRTSGTSETIGTDSAKAAATCEDVAAVGVAVDTSDEDVEAADKADNDNKKKASDTVVTEAAGSLPVSNVSVTSNINYVLCTSVLIGDGFHNFADGIFIGTAFLLCSTSVAISVLLATLYHEIAQEFADYVLLTKHAGLRPVVALALNFASGLLVLIGALVVMAVQMSDTAIGVVLAISAGVYLQIAATECMPRVGNATRQARDRFSAIAAFILGTIPIGLVLLNHPHC